jgi:hypothetical protein
MLEPRLLALCKKITEEKDLEKVLKLTNELAILLAESENKTAPPQNHTKKVA